MNENYHEIGIGATDELSLRVSVGTLVRVLFHSANDNHTMLALERTATLRETAGQSEVIVKAKPFGGAVQIINPEALKERIGDFHYDSERSREEKDFRIQTHPSSWEKIKDICRDHLDETKLAILDPSPERELVEEFEDALKVKINRNQYQLKQQGILIEDLPNETDNLRAEGRPTVRVYYIFEAWIESPDIIALMLANALQYSDKDLQKIAHEDALQGGKGRANALLILDLDELKNMHKLVVMDSHRESIHIRGHQLSGNVFAILDNNISGG